MSQEGLIARPFMRGIVLTAEALKEYMEVEGASAAERCTTPPA